MKTFIFSALALGMMASCSNTEVEGIDAVDNGEPVAIQLSAGVKSTVVVSRSAVTGSTEFTPTILGWEGKTVDYKTAPTWNAVSSGIAANATDPVDITLTPKKYYSADVSISTFMKAFYVSNEAATQEADAKYKYTIANTKGDIDVLLAPVVTGKKSDVDAKAFNFVHPLTQIKFVMKKGDGLAANTTLNSITLQNVDIPTGLDFSTEAPLTYTNSSALIVDGITTPMNIVADGVAGNPVMIKPMQTLNITVVTSTATFENLTVVLKGDTKFEAGKAYTITLTFDQKNIGGQASVVDWDDTGKGDVPVE